MVQGNAHLMFTTMSNQEKSHLEKPEILTAIIKALNTAEFADKIV
ncbi:MAG: hypothetical protein RLZZ507_4100 [Cyanobacteriota bacterium]|jgi:hypothetical protein